MPIKKLATSPIILVPTNEPVKKKVKPPSKLDKELSKDRLPKARMYAWSFSRWSDYMTCAFLAYCKYILRITEPPNKFMERGTTIHTEADTYLTGEAPRMPDSLKKFKKRFQELKSLRPYLEETWTFNSEWNRTELFSKDAWLRVKTDAHYVEDVLNGRKLFIIDFKTGKEDVEKHKMQLELYILGGMLMYPDVIEIEAQLWYLDSGTQVKRLAEKATEENLLKYKKLWLARTKAMLNDTLYPAQPNSKCRFCFYSRERNGPCKVG